MKEIKIVNDTYNYIKWVLPIIAKYPRNYRYTLGTRIENTLYDFMELLQKSYFVTDKHMYLPDASIKLEHLRIILRLSYDLRLFGNKIHHAMIEQMENIGKQLGGWIKSLDKPQ